jgi:hypothetical protein|tara:strand:+ start:169 stop:363 length:195 start_codon:yes stop_codon:yes gene_type:complete
MDDITDSLEQQKKDVVEETRQWVRTWDAPQREMVLWILQEEVRDDKLMNFKHENGDTTKSETLN